MRYYLLRQVATVAIASLCLVGFVPCKPDAAIEQKTLLPDTFPISIQAAAPDFYISETESDLLLNSDSYATHIFNSIYATPVTGLFLVQRENMPDSFILSKQHYALLDSLGQSWGKTNLFGSHTTLSRFLMRDLSARTRYTCQEIGGADSAWRCVKCLVPDSIFLTRAEFDANRHTKIMLRHCFRQGQTPYSQATMIYQSHFYVVKSEDDTYFADQSIVPDTVWFHRYKGEF